MDELGDVEVTEEHVGPSAVERAVAREERARRARIAAPGLRRDTVCFRDGSEYMRWDDGSLRRTDKVRKRKR